MESNNVRPKIAKAKVMENTSTAEQFQNTVLRPIIKMKHDLLIAHVKTYLAAKKNPLASLSEEKKIQYLTTVLQQDQTLRAELRGMIIGHFSDEEYTQYSSISSEINKRILNIIKERMIDHLNDLSS